MGENQKRGNEWRMSKIRREEGLGRGMRAGVWGIDGKWEGLEREAIDRKGIRLFSIVEKGERT